MGEATHDECGDSRFRVEVLHPKRPELVALDDNWIGILEIE
jgi:hypothetical protein